MLIHVFPSPANTAALAVGGGWAVTKHAGPHGLSVTPGFFGSLQSPHSNPASFLQSFFDCTYSREHNICNQQTHKNTQGEIEGFGLHICCPEEVVPNRES